MRAWLAERGVSGYAQMLLVMEAFDYPDFLTASADELLDGQYADWPALRPVLDTLLAFAATLESGAVQARKTYVTPVTPRRQFGLIRPTTRTRVDLGLRLADAQPGGKLLAAGSLGGTSPPTGRVQSWIGAFGMFTAALIYLPWGTTRGELDDRLAHREDHCSARLRRGVDRIHGCRVIPAGTPRRSPPNSPTAVW